MNADVELCRRPCSTCRTAFCRSRSLSAALPAPFGARSSRLLSSRSLRTPLRDRSETLSATLRISKTYVLLIVFLGFFLLRLFPLGAPSGSLSASPGTPVGAPGGAGRLQTGLSWSSEVGRQLPELFFLASAPLREASWKASFLKPRRRSIYVAPRPLLSSEKCDTYGTFLIKYKKNLIRITLLPFQDALGLPGGPFEPIECIQYSIFSIKIKKNLIRLHFLWKK